MVNTFEIMVHLAGIETKEGEYLSKCVKAISSEVDWHYFLYAEIIFENGNIVLMYKTSVFVYNGGTHPTSINSKRFGSGGNDFHSCEYWREFREAMVEVGKLYEF